MHTHIDLCVVSVGIGCFVVVLSRHYYSSKYKISDEMRRSNAEMISQEIRTE